MRKLILAALLASPVLLTAHPAKADLLSYKTGTEITDEQLEAAVVGKTTKQEITEAFGAPSRREQLGDTQVWYYDFTKISTFSKDKSVATVFEFDKAGLLASKARAGGGGKTGNPLLDAANGK